MTPIAAHRRPTREDLEDALASGAPSEDLARAEAEAAGRIREVVELIDLFRARAAALLAPQ